MVKRLTKSRDKKMAGVCGGFAEYFNLDPTLVRVVFAVATFLTIGFPGIICYAICAVIMPEY